MIKRFVIGILSHDLLGYLPYFYYIEEKKNHGFLPVEAKLSFHNKDRYLHLLTPRQVEMVKLCNEYSEQTLHKLFCKKKKITPRDFFESVNKELAVSQIIPYIQKRIIKVIDLLMEDPEETPVFFKGSRKFVHRDEQVFLQPHWIEPHFTIAKKPDATAYSVTLMGEHMPIELLDMPAFELVEEPARIVINNTLYRFRHLSSKKIRPFMQRASISIPAQSESTWYQRFGVDIVAQYDVNLKDIELETTLKHKQAHLFLQKNLQGLPVLALQFHYNRQVEFDSHSKKTVHVWVEPYQSTFKFHKIQRDPKWESELQSVLKQAELGNQEGNLWFPTNRTEGTIEELIAWLRKHRELIEQHNIAVHQKQLEANYSYDTYSVAPQIIEKQDWFDIYIKIQIGEFEIPFLRFRNHIKQKIKEYTLPNGQVFIIPDSWFERYADYLKFGSRVGEHIQLSKHHFQLLHNAQKMIKQNFLARYEQLIRKKDTQPEDLPEALQAQLRSYQQQGYSWMLQLKELHFGGCLADDMGLGKTLQTISLLCKLKENQHTYSGKLGTTSNTPIAQLNLFSQPSVTQKETEVREGSPTSLVIMPTALIFNWQNELKKFAPHLKIYVHIGTQRTRQVALFDLYDVVLTTYGTARNDSEILRTYLFDYLILDESQYIKNASSKAYKAILELQSVHKLVLTGTPIENSLTDLWSQINFLNKGLLGNLNFFKKEFVTPIEKHQDEEKKEKLKLMIEPFVLRRTKHEVAKDLPDKTEQVIYCEMSAEQQELYEKERSKIRNQLLNRLENPEEKPTLLAIEGLTRLRQLANHPQMLYSDYKGSAGKYNEVLSALDSILAEGHKVLIFSAYLKQLHLLSEELKQKEVNYATLTGQTRNRQKVIEEFSNNPKSKVFLIQIKAGGVGLNLTAADYVFILDPWWNPAVEEQAINRTHRIGQDKKVFVYRFLTLETVEEKIRKLQTSKSALADEFINTEELMSQMNLEKILDIIG
ncbi:MAG: DEAD/DEAH box helicase [Bacteroidales bacterium]